MKEGSPCVSLALTQNLASAPGRRAGRGAQRGRVPLRGRRGVHSEHGSPQVFSPDPSGCLEQVFCICCMFLAPILDTLSSRLIKNDLSSFAGSGRQALVLLCWKVSSSGTLRPPCLPPGLEGSPVLSAATGRALVWRPRRTSLVNYSSRPEKWRSSPMCMSPGSLRGAFLGTHLAPLGGLSWGHIWLP